MTEEPLNCSAMALPINAMISRAQKKASDLLAMLMLQIRSASRLGPRATGRERTS